MMTISEYKLMQIHLLLSRHQCGSSSCIYGPTSGQHTNGACKTMQENQHMKLRIELNELVGDLRRIMESDPTDQIKVLWNAEAKDLSNKNRFGKLPIE